MIVDSHAHFVPSSLLEALGAQSRLFPSVKVSRDAGGIRLAFAGAEPTRPVSPKLSDIAERETWLAEEGIDRQLVGGWLDMFGYELPPDEGAEWCRFMNEHLRSGSEKLAALAPLATVPLQNGARAAAVLEEALGAGFHGAMIGTQPKGSGGALDDPDLTPFWEAASASQAAIFLHPMYACGDDRLRDYDLVNAVGRLTDTTTAVARLLFSGHLQRYPGLRLIVSHGGAGLPYALGRLKRNHAIHPGKYADPADGFSRLYFDTVLFEPRALRFLCDLAGADKVMLGSDYPFPIGDSAPLRIVEKTALSAVERRAILGDTAARVFRLAPCSCGA
ncbi:MAG TPA: amidohydrolase family protein [Alphaproteobacteria bacterium]|nr:amidohydrolase family protein [Alphaproteobacteria bacterium]